MVLQTQSLPWTVAIRLARREEGLWERQEAVVLQGCPSNRKRHPKKHLRFQIQTGLRRQQRHQEAPEECSWVLEAGNRPWLQRVLVVTMTTARDLRVFIHTRTYGVQEF